MNRPCGAAVAWGLERLVDPGTVAGLSERQVLARFVDRRDPVAFEAIVARHGPMVLSVCRQTLRDANDVDDAFQATFLILVQKAGGLKRPERLAAWLYGVAHRVASRARRRRRAEGLPGDLAGRRLGEDPADAEDLAVLHDEIQRLPEKYRLPIVLCCMNEETHDAAAQKLGWPVGTVHGRLVRGRDLLRGRLLRRGLVIPEAIPRQDVRARTAREKVVPAPLLRSTLALLAGPIPNQLHHLVKGALSAMFIEKLRTAALVLAVTTVGVASAATALLAVQEPAKQSAQPAGSAGAQEPTAAMKKAGGQQPIDRFAAPAGGSFTARAAADAEEEHAAEETGTFRAKVELLELENDTLRARIQRVTASLDSLDDPAPGERPVWTAEQLEKESKLRSEAKRHKSEQLEGWNRLYLKNGLEIARLNYRIARIPRSSAAPERDDSGKTFHDLLRRIDRLEAKVDQLADSIRTARP